jgi:hypothetical protein
VIGLSDAQMATVLDVGRHVPRGALQEQYFREVYRLLQGQEISDLLVSRCANQAMRAISNTNYAEIEL